MVGSDTDKLAVIIAQFSQYFLFLNWKYPCVLCGGDFVLREIKMCLFYGLI